jgi:hypothetical protein
VSIVRHFRKRVATTAVLLVVLLALVAGCGPTPSRGWDTDPDKLRGQIAESMRDLLIASNFEPLPDEQLLPRERRMIQPGQRWPGTGTLLAWYQGATSFDRLESCIKDDLPAFESCRQEDYSQVWWIAEGEYGVAAPSEWEWILNDVNVDKHNLSYVALVIVLEDTGDRALVYADHHCAGECGGGILYTLERREDGWYVLKSKPMWKPEKQAG